MAKQDFKHIMEVDPLEVVNKIGDLYNFGEEVPTEVADKVEQMNKVQDEIQELMTEAVTLRDSFIAQTEEIANLKNVNTKLMYDSIKRNPKPKKEDIEAQRMEEAEDIARNIDIYDD